jgi:N4-gp56 family major capsid protein
MATEVVGTNHELTLKQWSEGLEAEVLKKITVTWGMGKRSDALFQIKDELESSPGDQITVGLRMQSTKAPVTSGTPLEGAEQVQSYYYDKFTIDEFADAFRFDNIMTPQRVTFDHRDEAKAALSDQLSHALDTSLFNQLAGVADPTVGGPFPTFQGHNAITAPDANHWIIAGTPVTEATLTATDLFSLDMVSEAKLKAKLLTPAIRPARIPGFGKALYVCFMHPNQAYNMKNNDPRWDEIQHSAMQGGKIDSNPFFTGALGVWDETLLVESSRVPLSAVAGVAAVPVRRAIFCGAQAAFMGWGRHGGNPERLRWVEKFFDFDRQFAIMGGFVCGVKKAVFKEDNAGAGVFDFATIVMSTASPLG